MDVEVEFEDFDEADLHPNAESRFFSCHVCGDNWLTLKEDEDEGDTQIIFVHQMGMQPTLKRIAHMQSPILVSSKSVDYWEYFLGDEPVDKSVWHRKLKMRRRILRSICSN